MNIILYRINPVLGCYEPPKPNPFECMSVEQQEHEVMQLVSKMDKLTRYLKIILIYYILLLIV